MYVLITYAYFILDMNVCVLQNTYIHVHQNNQKQLVNVIAIIYTSPNCYFYIDLDLTIFIRFLCVSEYRNIFEIKVINRKRLIAAHLRDIDYKSYKCYTQGHCESIVPTDKYCIHNFIVKRKSYLQVCTMLNDVACKLVM